MQQQQRTHINAIVNFHLALEFLRADDLQQQQTVNALLSHIYIYIYKHDLSLPINLCTHRMVNNCSKYCWICIRHTLLNNWDNRMGIQMCNSFVLSSVHIFWFNLLFKREYCKNSIQFSEKISVQYTNNIPNMGAHANYSFHTLMLAETHRPPQNRNSVARMIDCAAVQQSPDFNIEITTSLFSGSRILT